MRNGKLGKRMMPATASAGLEHARPEECRWQRWMPPRRESLRSGAGREKRGCASVCTHTSSTSLQWNDYNSLEVFYWPFTRVLTHCAFSRPVRASQWAGVNLPTAPRLQTFSTTDAAQRALSPPSSLVLQSPVQQTEGFTVVLTPYTSVRSPLAGQMGPSDLHLRASVSIYYSAVCSVSVSCVVFTLLSTVCICNSRLFDELWNGFFSFHFLHSGH